MFNRLPKAICMLSSCSVVGFKSKLDSLYSYFSKFLRNIVDLPCQPEPRFNTSLDGRDCLHTLGYFGLFGCI